MLSLVRRRPLRVEAEQRLVLSVWLDIVFRGLHIPKMPSFSATRDREFRFADIFRMSAERNMFILRAHVRLSGHVDFALSRIKVNIGRTLFARRTFGECPRRGTGYFVAHTFSGVDIEGRIEIASRTL